MTSPVRKTVQVLAIAVLALVLAMFAGGVWSLLLVANLQTSPAVPWAVVVMGLLVWLMWQYLGGRWWPRSTSEMRRQRLRARAVPIPVLAWSLAAGGLSIGSLAGLWIVLFRLAKVHGNPLPDFAQYPTLTVVLVIGTASLVTAAAEEAGFRGYLQGILERDVGGPLAIVITALVLEPGHGSTQGFAWPTMFFYFLVDAMLGVIAYLTNSILPGLAVHAAGLVVFFSLIWPNDPTRRPLESSGTDAWFWIHVAQTIVFATLAILAFGRLARMTRVAGTTPAASAV
jgi:membrane protease YdiL (CAAX protease family)